MSEISEVDAVRAAVVESGIAGDVNTLARDANDLVRQLRPLAGIEIYDLDMESLDGTQEYIMLLKDMFEFSGVALRPRRTRIHKLNDQPRQLSMTFQLQGDIVEWRFEHTSGWVSEEFLEHALSLLKSHGSGRLYCLLTDDAYAYLILLKPVS